MLDTLSTTPVFILAGGAGERLSPLTDAKPKPAVAFGGTHQILDFTFSNSINSGFRRIFVLTQYQRDHLHDYVREARQRFSSALEWRNGEGLLALPPVSGKRYRGTADAVFQNLQLVRFDIAEHVLITSGDHIYSMDYRPLLARHIATGAELTVAAVRRPVREATQFGVLDVEDDVVTGFREKPASDSLPRDGDILVSMGVYVFKRSSLIDIADRAKPSETDFGRDVLPKLIGGQRVRAYDFGNSPRPYWRDVGSLDSYFNANMDLLGPTPEFDPEIDSNWPIVSLRDSFSPRAGCSRISHKAVIGASTIRRSVVSHGVCIERGAIIENSVVLPGAHVGKYVHLRNTIVAEGARVPDFAQVGMHAGADRARFAITPGGVVIFSPSASRSGSDRRVGCAEAVTAA